MKYKTMLTVIQRMTAFICCSICQCYCTTDLADIMSIIDTADHAMFLQILTNPNHDLKVHLLAEKRKPAIQTRDLGSTIGRSKLLN